MADKKHRILGPADGIHPLQAFPAGDPYGIAGLAASDIGRVAWQERSGEPGYYDFYILSKFDGGVVWVPLGGFPDELVRWTIEPEGFPASLNDIEPTPDDLHHLAFDPSGATKYWMLYAVTPDGSGGYDGSFVALDQPAPDLSGKADKRLDRVNVSGTTRTITAVDFDTFLASTNAALQTFTLSSVAETPVRSLVVFQAGAGRIRFTAGGGVTLRPSGTIETSGQYAAATVSLIGTNEWLVSGDVSVS